MKKIIIGIIILACYSALTHTENIEVIHAPNLPQNSKTQHKPELVERDFIEVVIYTIDGNEIITHSEIIRPSLQGERRTRDDAVFETLVYLDAKKHKIEPDEDAVDRYLAKIMEENNINLGQMEEIFRQGGRSLKEGREELRRMQAVGSMIDFKIRSNLMVPRKDVEAYYHAHPQIKPARYSLRYVHIPFYSMMTKAEQQKELMRKVRAEGIDFLGLSEPFWVTHGEIAEEKEDSVYREYEHVRDNLKRFLEDSKREEVAGKAISDLKDKYSIKIEKTFGSGAMPELPMMSEEEMQDEETLQEA